MIKFFDTIVRWKRLDDSIISRYWHLINTFGQKIDIEWYWLMTKNTWCQVSDTSYKYINNITLSWRWPLETNRCPHDAVASASSLSFSLFIYCNLYCNVLPDAALKTVRWLDHFTISPTWLIHRPKIDVDWYWWWKIHGVKCSIPRASISVPSLAVESNPAPVTCCFCKLVVSFCFLLSLSFSSTILFPPTYLSPYLSDCTLLLLLVNVTRSRSPTENL